jgi:hypothetical protein
VPDYHRCGRIHLEHLPIHTARQPADCARGSGARRQLGRQGLAQDHRPRRVERGREEAAQGEAVRNHLVAIDEERARKRALEPIQGPLAPLPHRDEPRHLDRLRREDELRVEQLQDPEIVGHQPVTVSQLAVATDLVAVVTLDLLDAVQGGDVVVGVEGAVHAERCSAAPLLVLQVADRFVRRKQGGERRSLDELVVHAPLVDRREDQ